MSNFDDLRTRVSNLDEVHKIVVKNHWNEAQTTKRPISKFDSLCKGWDRLASELYPEDQISFRFKKLTGECTVVAWSQSIDALLSEPDGPIRNDIGLVKDSQADFERAQRNFRKHRNCRSSDSELMKSIGSLLWTVRSNSMHGRKTTSGPKEPTNRDEQICELGANVLMELYGRVFPDWRHNKF